MQRRAWLLTALLAPLALGATAARAESPTPLEINAATQAQLEALPGIGPALAEKILAARQVAPFVGWVDLRRRVRGIGPQLAHKLSNAGLRVAGREFVEADTK